MSGTDHLRVDPNERVDLSDFDFAVDNGVSAGFENLVGQFFTDPTGQRAWIIDGFLVDNADGLPLGGVQVRSTRGRAILSRIESGVVSHGIVVAQGDATKIIDISTFSPGDYGVYVRFQFIDGDNESRAFWDSSSDEEFAQTIATRRKATWSMRIEGTSPGAEWFQIAEITVSASVISALTDKRDFYFEGDAEHTYPSDWSTDSDPTGAIDELPVTSTVRTPTWPAGSGPTGVATTSNTSDLAVGDFVRLDSDLRWYKLTAITPNTDFTFADVHAHGGTLPSGTGLSSIQTHRSTDRANEGIKDLQTFASATRQLIEDIKGRGLRRWWERDIGGLNVGFDADPVEGLLAVGDADFGLDGSVTTSPQIHFDKANNDRLEYDRTTDSWSWKIGGTEEFFLNANYARFRGDVNVFSGGLAVGYSADDSAIGDDDVTVGDADFGLIWHSVVPRIDFESGSYLQLTRGGAAGIFRFFINNGNEVEITKDGVGIMNGMTVGFLGTPPVNDVVAVGDAEFQLDGSTINTPTLQFESAGGVSGVQFNRTADLMSMLVRGNSGLDVEAAGTAQTPRVRLLGAGGGRLQWDYFAPTGDAPRQRELMLESPEDRFFYKDISDDTRRIPTNYIPLTVDRTIEDTDIETDFLDTFAQSFPANVPETNNVLRLHVAGSGVTTASPNLILRIRWNGLSGAILAIIPLASLTSNFSFSFITTITFRSPSTSVHCSTHGTWENGGVRNAITDVRLVTIINNISKDIDVTGGWTVGSLSNSVSLETFILEWL